MHSPMQTFFSHSDLNFLPYCVLAPQMSSPRFTTPAEDADGEEKKRGKRGVRFDLSREL